MFFINGSFVQREQANISVLDLGFLRGHAAFEYLRTYNKKPFHLNEHLDRFFFSLKQIQLSIPQSFEELKNIILELIKKTPEKDIGIKIIATGGISEDQFLPKGNSSLIIFTAPISLYPSHSYEIGIETITTHLQRCVPTAKTLMYLPAVITLSQHRSAKEALYLNAKDEFLEATTSNLFFIKEGKLITSDSQEILFGITREVVLHLAKDLMPIELRNLSLKELDSVDEAFITATNKEIMPVMRIDSQLIGNGNTGLLTKKLIARFNSYVQEGIWHELSIPRHLQAGSTSSLVV